MAAQPLAGEVGCTTLNTLGRLSRTQGTGAVMGGDPWRVLLCDRPAVTHGTHTRPWRRLGQQKPRGLGLRGTDSGHRERGRRDPHRFSSRTGAERARAARMCCPSGRGKTGPQGSVSGDRGSPPALEFHRSFPVGLRDFLGNDDSFIPSVPLSGTETSVLCLCTREAGTGHTQSLARTCVR